MLIAYDTTFFNFSTDKAFQGGGPIESLNDKGILVHSALAMIPEGVPLGLVGQKFGPGIQPNLGKRANGSVGRLKTMKVHDG